jgi:hypothetical protein
MLVKKKWKQAGSGSARDVCKRSNGSGKQKKCECNILYKHQTTVKITSEKSLAVLACGHV